MTDVIVLQLMGAVIVGVVAGGLIGLLIVRASSSPSPSGLGCCEESASFTVHGRAPQRGRHSCRTHDGVADK